MLQTSPTQINNIESKFQLIPNQQPYHAYGSAGDKDRGRVKRENRPAPKPSSGKSGKAAYSSMYYLFKIIWILLWLWGMF